MRAEGDSLIFAETKIGTVPIVPPLPGRYAKAAVEPTTQEVPDFRRHVLPMMGRMELQQLGLVMVLSKARAASASRSSVMTSRPTTTH